MHFMSITKIQNITILENIYYELERVDLINLRSTNKEIHGLLNNFLIFNHYFHLEDFVKKTFTWETNLAGPLWSLLKRASTILIGEDHTKFSHRKWMAEFIHRFHLCVDNFVTLVENANQLRFVTIKIQSFLWEKTNLFLVEEQKKFFKIFLTCSSLFFRLREETDRHSFVPLAEQLLAYIKSGYPIEQQKSLKEDLARVLSEHPSTLYFKLAKARIFLGLGQNMLEQIKEQRRSWHELLANEELNRHQQLLSNLSFFKERKILLGGLGHTATKYATSYPIPAMLSEQAISFISLTPRLDDEHFENSVRAESQLPTFSPGNLRALVKAFPEDANPDYYRKYLFWNETEQKEELQLLLERELNLCINEYLELLESLVKIEEEAKKRQAEEEAETEQVLEYLAKFSF